MTNKIAATALIITSITLLSKLTGMIRDVVIAASYGTSIESDAFFMAQTIISVIIALALAALGTTFIPVMSDYVLYKTHKETNNFLNVVYTVTISIAIIISILALIFTQEIVRLFAPGFSSQAYALTVKLTQIMLPIIVVTALVTLNNAKLHNHGSFLVPASIGFPMNLLMIITMLFLTDSHGIEGLVIALVIGTMLQIVWQIPFTRRLGYRYKFNFDLKEEGIRRIGILIVPILIGSSIQEINTTINRILASGLPEGSISALNFSNRLSLFIIGLLSAAVVSVYYTSLSNYFTAGKDEQFKKLLRNTINISILLITPATVGLIVLRFPIIQLIFQRGMFDSTASEMTAIALLYYSFGLIGFLLRDVLSRAFYALKDTRIVMINGSIAVGLNIVLSVVFVRYLGLGGLALATSISGIIGTILLMFNLHVKIGDFGLRNIMTTMSKVLIASIVMGIVVYYCYKFVFYLLESNVIAVLISGFGGLLLYGSMVSLLKISEAHVLKDMLFAQLKARLKMFRM